VLGAPGAGFTGPGWAWYHGRWHYKDERATEMVYTFPADEWKARQQVSGIRRRSEAPI